MSFNSQTDYDLARARKFIASMEYTKGKYSVGIRMPRPSPNKPKFPYYVLIEKFADGHTKTVNKAYDINTLMAPLVQGDAMTTALWNNTRPDQPKATKNNATVNRCMLFKLNKGAWETEIIE